MDVLALSPFPSREPGEIYARSEKKFREAGSVLRAAVGRPARGARVRALGAVVAATMVVVLPIVARALVAIVRIVSRFGGAVPASAGALGTAPVARARCSAVARAVIRVVLRPRPWLCRWA